MTPIVYCIRHAQGTHNVAAENSYDIRDPALTPFGEQQCREFAAKFPHHEQIELIVTSPLRRAISTALLSFPSQLEKGVKVVAMPELQEVGDMPCDSGSELAFVKEVFKDSPVDFSLVQEGWEKKEGVALNTLTAIQRRADAARKWLKSRPEKGIAVISHGCFLHFLTDDWVDSLNVAVTGWANNECRSYEFTDCQAEDAHLVETSTSRLARGISKPHSNAEEQLALREKTVDTWLTWGVISRRD